MDDWIAKIYIVDKGAEYRVKVFDHAVFIERQQPTHGDNVLYDRAEAGTVWDGSVFDTEALAGLIDRYEADTRADYGASQRPVTYQDESE